VREEDVIGLDLEAVRSRERYRCERILDAFEDDPLGLRSLVAPAESLTRVLAPRDPVEVVRRFLAASERPTLDVCERHRPFRPSDRRPPIELRAVF
jgi:hypothetical protein